MTALGVSGPGASAAPDEGPLQQSSTFASRPGVGVESELVVSGDTRIEHASAYGASLFAVTSEPGASSFNVTRTIGQDTTIVGQVARATPGVRAVIAASGPDSWAVATVDDTVADGVLADTNVTFTTSDGLTQTLSGVNNLGLWDAQRVWIAANGDHALVFREMMRGTSGGVTAGYRYVKGSGWTFIGAPGIHLNPIAFDLKVDVDGTGAFVYSYTNADGSISHTGGATVAARRGTWDRAPLNQNNLVKSTAAVRVENGVTTAYWVQDEGSLGTVRSATFDPSRSRWSAPVQEPALDRNSAPMDLSTARGLFGATDVDWPNHTGAPLESSPTIIQQNQPFNYDASGPAWRYSPTVPAAQGGDLHTDARALLSGPRSNETRQLATTAWTVAPDVIAPHVVEIAAGTSVTLTGSDRNGVQLTRCEVIHTPVGGEPGTGSQSGVTVAGNDCRWDISVATTGAYALTAEYADAAGNTTTATKTFTAGSTTPPADPPVTTPTVTGPTSTTRLPTGENKGTWTNPTNLTSPTWTKELTVYTPANKVLRVRTWTDHDATTTKRVPNGTTACLRVRVSGAEGHTDWTAPSCLVSGLEGTNKTYVKRFGSTNVVHRTRHGRSWTATRLRADQTHPGRLTVKVAKGARIRLRTSGRGTATVHIPGTRPVLLTGRTARGKTFTATKSGTVKIVRTHHPSSTQPSRFSVHHLVISYR